MHKKVFFLATTFHEQIASDLLSTMTATNPLEANKSSQHLDVVSGVF
jgi:hypothetical protein